MARGDRPGTMGGDLPPIDLAGASSTELAVGGGHTCALLSSDRSLVCWGGNGFGQLGYGDLDDRPGGPGTLVRNDTVVDVGEALHLSAFGQHTCVLLSSGNLTCWGSNSEGQLGLEDRALAVSTPGRILNFGSGRTAIRVVAGSEHTCALLDDSSARCWGRNSFGQLGYGDVLRRGQDGTMGDALPAIDLGPDSDVEDLALGDASTCALLKSGAVKCWGLGLDGRLGYGDLRSRGHEPGTMGANLPALDLGTNLLASSLTSGAVFVCAVLKGSTSGGVKCWGNNEDGTLGQGDRVSRGTSPSTIGDNLPFVDLGVGRSPVDLAAGHRHVCARWDDSSVKCWGSNADGQLGYEDTKDRGQEPLDMGDMLPLVALSAQDTSTTPGREELDGQTNPYSWAFGPLAATGLMCCAAACFTFVSYDEVLEQMGDLAGPASGANEEIAQMGLTINPTVAQEDLSRRDQTELPELRASSPNGASGASPTSTPVSQATLGTFSSQARSARQVEL